MLSPQLRQKVYSLWTMFWASGMTNPLTSIEQITYLLFLKQLENLDAQRIARGKPSLYGKRPDCKLPHIDNSDECSGHEFCRWSHITQHPTYDLFHQYVFPWLRELDKTLALLGNGDVRDLSNVRQGIMEDAYFQFPREKAKTLERAIKTVDELFPQISLQNSDLMGDIFEYLLSETKTSGKNGQFRTPRHIIRFMVELINPQPGERVIDPAAGTSGFLFSTVQHLLKQVTPTDKLRLEADGTPHRLVRGDPKIEPHLAGENFSGYDNDRTMVRIGWMNLILHGIESPHLERFDSLGQSLPDSETGTYHVGLANPPFTGTVDEGDLHKTRFPRDPRNDDNPITTRSELLFVWLLLDLLRDDGRAAIIVPEGILFGSTTAHRKLRHQLLFEHHLKAVISLPPGAFQPYAGVKTSILFFQKVGDKAEPGKEPYTREVWFYEVQADGYTLDAKRTLQPEPNDLYDALEKYDPAGNSTIESLDYYQPNIITERWRVVDSELVSVFPDLELRQGEMWGIHELFTDLPANPQTAERQVIDTQTLNIKDLFRRYVIAKLTEEIGKVLIPPDEVQAKKLADRTLRDLRRMFLSSEDTTQILDTEFEQFGIKVLQTLIEQPIENIKMEVGSLLDMVVEESNGEARPQTEEDWQSSVREILHEFAKLDGFNIPLRTAEIYKKENGIEESRCWVAPVRVYARDDDWKSKNGEIVGTHDENDQVRPTYIEYLKQQDVFDENGAIKSEHLIMLDPDCIEANDFNLSAGRYKPIELSTKKYDPPAEILRVVQKLERDLLAGIENLLEMVESDTE